MDQRDHYAEHRLSVEHLATPTFLSCLRPQNNYTNSTLHSTTVAALQGVGGANESPVPYGLLGFVTFDGVGNLIVSTDENLGRSLSTHSYTGICSVASNGRTVLTGFGAAASFSIVERYWLHLGNDAAVTAGTMVPQAPPHSTTPRSAALIRVDR